MPGLSRDSHTCLPDFQHTKHDQEEHLVRNKILATSCVHRTEFEDFGPDLWVDTHTLPELKHLSYVMRFLFFSGSVGGVFGAEVGRNVCLQSTVRNFLK